MQSRRGGWILLSAVVSAAMLWGCQSAETRTDPEIHIGVGTRLSASADKSDGSLRAESAETIGKGAPQAVVTVAAVDSTPKVKAANFDVSSDAPIDGSRSQRSSAPQNPSLAHLTLDQAIATSLDRNPTLIAQRAADPVAQAAVKVAETYPFNPYVQMEVIPYARDIDGSLGAVKHYVYLMQTLELAHQQRYREAGAAAALNQVRWNIVAAEVTNAALAERLYFTALYQRELRDLARQSASLNERLRGVVERRFNANLAGTKPTDMMTVQAAERQSRKQAELAEANYQTALMALRRELNLSNDEPVALVGRMADFAWLPIDGLEAGDADKGGAIHVSPQVTASLAAERPDVRAAAAGTNVAQANADLARANRCQNLQVGPYYERDELGTVFVGVRLQSNLPVWDDGRPLLHQREAELQHQCITVEQLRARAEIEIRTAVERYERARLLAARERGDFMRPLSEQLRRINDLFAEGQADILSVFAVQTSLLQEQRTYLDLLNELALAASDVTLTAGLPPSRLVSGNADGGGPSIPPAPPSP